jgi:hypothetical protein
MLTLMVKFALYQPFVVGGVLIVTAGGNVSTANNVELLAVFPVESPPKSQALTVKLYDPSASVEVLNKQLKISEPCVALTQFAVLFVLL